MKRAQVRLRGPNRFIVGLAYRTPVARVKLPGSLGTVLLDEEAVILPYEDISKSRAERLILFLGLDPPFDTTPGLVWKSEESSGPRNLVAQRVRSAVRLAAFLKAGQDREAKPIPPALRPKVFRLDARGDFWLQNEQSTSIYWPPHNESEAPWEVTAEHRWGALHEWFKDHTDAVPHPYYLNFTREGIEVRKGNVPQR